MKSPTRAQAGEMLAKLLANRCSNYGYSAVDFQRVSNQRSRARAAMRKSSYMQFPESLNWACTTCIYWDAMSFTFQSPNEGVTNCLRQLLSGHGARWVS